MKINFNNSILLLLSFTLLQSCSKSDTSANNSTATTVTIGNQVWMKKNLDVDHYRNGDPIPQVTDPTQWANLTTGAWCYYNNDPANGAIYGKLYNWYAVNDPRGLAPAGYHIPSDTEWSILTTFLGGEEIAGDKMKSISGWITTSVVTNTNSSGFTGLPGGCITNISDTIGYSGYWWASSEYSTDLAWSRCLNYISSDIAKYYYSKTVGLSVRCLKD